MQKEKEKRKFQRWIKKLIVVYSTLEGIKVEELTVTENISLGGLQVTLIYKLEKDEPVETKIEFINDPIPVDASCKVCYSYPERGKFRTGLEFIKMEDFHNERLLRYLEKEGI